MLTSMILDDEGSEFHKGCPASRLNMERDPSPAIERKLYFASSAADEICNSLQADADILWGHCCRCFRTNVVPNASLVILCTTELGLNLSTL